MHWQEPRQKLLICAGLDLLGLIAFSLGNAVFKLIPLWPQVDWLLLLALLYLGFGWLFGSYTVLRWRRLPIPTLLQRVFLTGLVTAVGMALSRQIVNPSDQIWLVHRSTQIVLFPALMLWSSLWRVLLRRGVLVPPSPVCVLVSDAEECSIVRRAWQLTPPREHLKEMSLTDAVKLPPPLVVAVGSSLAWDREQIALLSQLESRDPRETVLTTPLALIERQLERLPPRLLPEPWLQYAELPSNRTFSFERQLKRVGDLLVALTLLFVTSPLLLAAMLLIWLEDQGSVFYIQERSGWLGQPFCVYKLRTMTVASSLAEPHWTKPGDQRITWIGQWLRKSRLDELPQLFNVLRGDMSLIGPRPELPEFEQILELKIPHYRKRHWMRPGLSGWSQVCAPYAASVEDTELKLSYDLYYLKNFSIWLDLIILFRTIKTILKVSGR